MSLRTWKNQFQGLNPLLMKHLFEPGEDSVWPSFHAAQIAHLRSTLNKILPERYVAHAEQSLQIRFGDLPEQQGRPQKPLRPIPDVSIYRGFADPIRPRAVTLPAQESSPTWSAIVDYNILEKMMPAIVIRDVETRSHSLLGEPVTRIEVLSPDNMAGSAGYPIYLRNRGLALKSGTSLVEIDYLHDFQSPVEKVMELPSYPQENGAYPYTIVLNHAQPNQEVLVNVYGFGVDDSIPTVKIPLMNEESVTVNFDSVHAEIYEEERWGLYVNYQSPLDTAWLKTFSPRDQQRLVNRRLAILDAHQRGVSLDSIVSLYEVSLSLLQAEGFVHPDITPTQTAPFFDSQQNSYWFGILPKENSLVDACLIIRQIDNSDTPIQTLRITSGQMDAMNQLNKELAALLKAQGIPAVFDKIQNLR